MVVNTRGIVLRILKYSDSQNIIEVYTEAQGRVSFLLRIPKSRKSRIKSVLFQPLSLLLLEWNSRPTIQLQKLQNAKPAFLFTGIPYEPKKTAMALFLSEFLCGALREEQKNDAMFRYIFLSIEWLDRGVASCANFHLVFLLRLSRFLGFYPNLDNYRPGCFFDMQNSSFSAKEPPHPHFVSPQYASRLPILMRMRYETMHKFIFSRDERELLLKITNTYYRLHIPSFPALKSLDVLKEVFS